MAQNKHKTKRRIICILCASIIALYALAIPIGAVVNSSQVPEGSTALYGVSTFPFTVGFVQKDTVNDKNYIFATEIGAYGQNNNQTVEGSDIFYWNFPDASGEESGGITYTQGSYVELPNDMRYTDFQNFFNGGYRSINLQYNQITPDMIAETESIIFKADNVYYNPLWTTEYDSVTNEYKYKNTASAGYEYMIPTIYLPTIDTSTQKFVGRYSVECSIIDLKGERHNISYSIPIDTSVEVDSFDFLSISSLQQFIDPTEIEIGLTTQQDVTNSNSTILIEQYRGYLDVDYYDYVVSDELSGTWVLNNVIRPYNEISTPIESAWITSGNYSTALGIFSAYDGSSVVSNDIHNFMIYTVSGAADNITIFNINSNPSTYPYVTYTRNGADIYHGSGSSNHTRVVRSDYDGQYTITFNDSVELIGTEKYNQIFAWLQANATKQGSTATVATEGTWEKVTDTDLLNQVLVTYPMYDTSGAVSPTAFSNTWLATPDGLKMLEGTKSIYDKGDELIIIPEIDEDMYKDYTGWLGTAVKGFFDTPLLGGMSLGVIVGVLVMFGCAIALLKIFAGG